MPLHMMRWKKRDTRQSAIAAAHIENTHLPASDAKRRLLLCCSCILLLRGQFYG